MNKTIIIGRITKDFTANESGKQGNCTIAVERPYPFNKDKDGKDVSDFLAVRFIGEKNVQRATRFLTKGTKVVITGSYFRDSWKDNEGNWKESNYIMATEFEFAESLSARPNNGTSNSPAPQADTSKGTDGFMSIPDNVADGNLPFN